MKLATIAKLPKKTLARANDPGNPAWTEDMLGAPVLKRGRGTQVTPTKVLTSVLLYESLVLLETRGAISAASDAASWPHPSAPSMHSMQVFPIRKWLELNEEPPAQRLR